MIVRLHNLSARAPAMADLNAVTELIITCDIAETAIADHSKEDVRSAWQVASFNLKTDAWVIVTNKEQIVGYADVRRSENEQLASSVRVHPDYRGRGIGTLLIWLVEERARQFVSKTPLGVCVTLSTAVSSLNQAAKQLFEREGYTLTRSFWRLMIELEDVPATSYNEFSQHGRLKLDLAVGLQNLMGTPQVHRRTGLYTTHQYDVYQKELRGCEEPQMHEDLNWQPLAV